MASLRAECARYKKQVADMTKFLSDYGLTWVGDPDEEEFDDAEQELDNARLLDEEMLDSNGDLPASPEELSLASPQAASQRSASGQGLPINVAELEKSVRSLNGLAEQGSRVVSRKVGGAVHAHFVSEQASLPLVLFSDGLKLGELQFEPYGSPRSNGMLRDIVDGYFPYALKDAYPDGVALRIVDRTSQTFSHWCARSTVDPDINASGSRCAPGSGSALSDPLSGAPSRVVKNGEVHHVHENRSRGLSQEPGPREDQISLLSANRDATAAIARLQVRSESGARLLLKMELRQTIGDLEDALDRWRSDKGLSKPEGKKLVLRTAFPPSSYIDRGQSLEMAGLTPSATLFVAVEPADSQSTN